MRSAFGWVLPAQTGPNPFELTPEQERAAIIRTLAGDYPGPTRLVIATALADRLIAIRDRAAEGES